MNARLHLFVPLISLIASVVGAQTISLPVRVNNDGAGHRQFAPYLALDSSGTLYVGWTDYRNNSGGDIYVARSTDNGATFSAGVPVRTGGSIPSGMQRGLHLAADNQGRLHLVWMETRTSGTSDLYYATSTDGVNFSTPMSIADDSLRHNQDFPSLGVDASGGVYVSWIDDREPRNGISGNTQLYFRRSIDGGMTWDTVRRINVMPGGVGGTCECCNTSMDVTPSGSISITFRSNVDNKRDVFLVRSQDRGDSFMEAVDLASEAWIIPVCPMSGSSVRVDQQGKAHVIWRDARSSLRGRDGIFYNALGDGESLAPLDRKISDASAYVNYASLAIGSRGELLAVYQQGTGSEADIRLVTSLDGGATFSPSTSIAAGQNGAHELPVLLAGRDGVVYTVWSDTRRDAGDILLSRITFPASSLSSDEMSSTVIYPTPTASDHVVVRLASDVKSYSAGSITIIASDGAVVKSMKLDSSRHPAGSEMLIDIRDHPSGVYRLQIVTGLRGVTLPLVVVR